jgi:hypothetical protein
VPPLRLGLAITTLDDRSRMTEFFRDLFDFLRARKKIWLLPVILVLVVLGGLVVVSQQSVLGTFIYTLF